MTAIACACYITRITRCASHNDYPLSCLTPTYHTHSYVETEHSKEGTNVQLSVRGKMLPAQVSDAAGVCVMCVGGSTDVL
jgi:hypothetical protein